MTKAFDREIRLSLTEQDISALREKLQSEDQSKGRRALAFLLIVATRLSSKTHPLFKRRLP